MSESKVTRKHTTQELVQAVRIGSMIGLGAAADIGSQGARELAPVDTTRLSKSIHRTEVAETNDLHYEVQWGTNVEYASAHEFGSGIHDPSGPHLILIEAGIFTGKSSKRALSFGWPNAPESMKKSGAFNPKTGKFVFAHIHHPGVPAHPYLRPSLNLGTPSRDAARQKLADLAISAIAAQLRGGGR
jgi:hypothetical protein